MVTYMSFNDFLSPLPESLFSSEPCFCFECGVEMSQSDFDSAERDLCGHCERKGSLAR